MKDPIERQDVIDLLSGVYHYMGSWLVQYIEDGISSIPSAQPEPSCKFCEYARCVKGDSRCRYAERRADD